LWAQPHPDSGRTIDDCSKICDDREGCTGFEFAVGNQETGACGTYTSGDANKQNDENRLDPNSNWRSCMKSFGERTFQDNEGSCDTNSNGIAQPNEATARATCLINSDCVAYGSPGGGNNNYYWYSTAVTGVNSDDGSCHILQKNPSTSPSNSPTTTPTQAPSVSSPSQGPSESPSQSPSKTPSLSPTLSPTPVPRDVVLEHHWPTHSVLAAAWYKCKAPCGESTIGGVAVQQTYPPSELNLTPPEQCAWWCQHEPECKVAWFRWSGNDCKLYDFELSFHKQDFESDSSMMLKSCQDGDRVSRRRLQEATQLRHKKL